MKRLGKKSRRLTDKEYQMLAHQIATLNRLIHLYDHYLTQGNSPLLFWEWLKHRDKANLLPGLDRVLSIEKSKSFDLIARVMAAQEDFS